VSPKNILYSLLILLLMTPVLTAQQETEEVYSVSQVILRFDGKDQYIMLNPMRIYSPYNGLYFALRLRFTPAMMNLKISAGDRLLINLDHGQVELKAYEVKTRQSEISCYYSIDKWDLVDIGNARTASVTVWDSAGSQLIPMSRLNINEYRLFASTYILGRLFIPEYNRRPERHWGFVGVGYGTMFGAWVAKYFNLFVPTSGFASGEFVGIGFGYSPFTYYVYKVYRITVLDPENGWYLKYGYGLPETRSEPVYQLGLIYGFVNHSLLEPASAEAGITVQYFFQNTRYDKAYLIHQTPLSYDSPEMVYRATGGVMRHGFAAGIFLQAGAFWIHANTLNVWTTGLSTPVPWW
jgi:hypothetical protein